MTDKERQYKLWQERIEFTNYFKLFEVEQLKERTKK